MTPVDDEHHGLTRMFQALASDERRALLSLLRDAHTQGSPGMTITQLAERSSSSRFTASRNLGVLRAAGLVQATHEGTKRVHRLDFAAMNEVEDWIYEFVGVDVPAMIAPGGRASA